MLVQATRDLVLEFTRSLVVFFFVLGLFLHLGQLKHFWGDIIVVCFIKV